MDRNEINNLLKSKNYTEEEINSFLKMMEPLFNFYDFMLKEHNMNYDDVEKDSSEFSQSIFSEYLENMKSTDNQMKYMLEVSGDIIKRYANKYDYKESEAVKISLNKYMEFFLKSQFKKNE